MTGKINGQNYSIHKTIKKTIQPFHTRFLPNALQSLKFSKRNLLISLDP